MLTSELKGAQLDYFVGLACKKPVRLTPEGCKLPNGAIFSPSTIYAHGGPLIEEFGVNLFRTGKHWFAEPPKQWWRGPFQKLRAYAFGETYLIACMRCIAGSHFGESIPDDEAYYALSRKIAEASAR